MRYEIEKGVEENGGLCDARAESQIQYAFLYMDKRRFFNVSSSESENERSAIYLHFTQIETKKVRCTVIRVGDGSFIDQ